MPFEGCIWERKHVCNRARAKKAQSALSPSHRGCHLKALSELARITYVTSPHEGLSS